MGLSTMSMPEVEADQGEVSSVGILPPVGSTKQQSTKPLRNFPLFPFSWAVVRATPCCSSSHMPLCTAASLLSHRDDRRHVSRLLGRLIFYKPPCLGLVSPLPSYHTAEARLVSLKISSNVINLLMTPQWLPTDVQNVCNLLKLATNAICALARFHQSKALFLFTLRFVSSLWKDLSLLQPCRPVFFIYSFILFFLPECNLPGFPTAPGIISVRTSPVFPGSRMLLTSSTKPNGTSTLLFWNSQTLDLFWLIYPPHLPLPPPPPPYYRYYLRCGYFQTCLPSQVEGDQGLEGRG